MQDLVAFTCIYGQEHRQIYCFDLRFLKRLSAIWFCLLVSWNDSLFLFFFKWSTMYECDDGQKIICLTENCRSSWFVIKEINNRKWSSPRLFVGGQSHVTFMDYGPKLNPLWMFFHYKKAICFQVGTHTTPFLFFIYIYTQFKERQFPSQELPFPILEIHLPPPTTKNGHPFA